MIGMDHSNRIRRSLRCDIAYSDRCTAVMYFRFHKSTFTASHWDLIHYTLFNWNPWLNRQPVSLAPALPTRDPTTLVFTVYHQHFLSLWRVVIIFGWRMSVSSERRMCGQHLVALLHQRTLEKTYCDNDRNSLIIGHP